MHHRFKNPNVLIFTPLMVFLLFAVACGGAATAPQTTVVPADPAAPVDATAPAASDEATTPLPVAQRTEAAPTEGEPVQERLRVAVVPPYIQGTLGWIMGGTPQGLLQPIQEHLVQVDYVTGELVPMLATEWEMTADGRNWTFKLRQNIPCHQGGDFTARDVVLGWELVTGEDSAAGRREVWRNLVGVKENIEIVNDHEFVYHLQRPELTIPFLLADVQTDLTVYCKGYWDEVGQDGFEKNPVGTGPYEFREFKQGTNFRFERVTYDHWRVAPDFKELEFLMVPEDATRLAMILTEEADISEVNREGQVDVLAAGMKIARSSLPAYSAWIGIGGQYLQDKRDPDDPNTNVLVRKAMNLAIDREGINKAIFGGKGELMANMPYHISDESFNPEWKVYPYDPEEAKRILVEAGYPEGVGVKFMIGPLAGVPELPDMGLAAAQMLEAVGFTVELQVGEFAPIRSAFRARALQNTLWTHRTGFWPGWRNIPVYYTSPKAEGIVFMYENPVTDELYNRFINSIDVVERRQLMTEIGDIIYNDYGTIPLVYLYGEYAINPEVVVDYKVNNSYFGALKGHEYTKAVRK